MRTQKTVIFAIDLKRGTLAQLVEQRTENPCVPGSIPGGTTKSIYKPLISRGLFLKENHLSIASNNTIQL